MAACDFPPAAGAPPPWSRLLVLLALAAVLQAAPKWPPVDPAELAETKPKVDAEAGAEVLLREVDVDQSAGSETELREHVRVKIFSARGVDDFAKVDIPYDEDGEVSDIAARTIKPDGSVLELNPKDVFDREVIKSGDVRIKVKSFAPPGLEPGAIVEYRFTQTTDRVNMFVEVYYQGPLPVRSVRYRLRPPPFRFDVTIRSISFNCPAAPLNPDRDGYYRFEASDLPAAKPEPYQPPEINTRAGLIVYYTLKDPLPADKFWGQFSKELSDDLDSAARVSKPVRTALAGIVAPADPDEMKLQKIHDFCRTKIVNRSHNSARFTAEQRRKLKANESPADTLKSGSGTPRDVNLLFAALVRAAGMEARWAACNDRHLILFNSKIGEPFMLTDRVVAVRQGDVWRYCDPGATYLPLGTLAWADSDTVVLLADPKGAGKLTTVAGTPPEATMRTRTATLQLDGDGTMEGDVTEVCTGQLGAALKYTLDGKTDTEREEYVRKEIQEHQKQAEVTAVTVANAADPIADLKISYHLRIPEYADRTDTRLFFQPAVLQKGVPPEFEAATRRGVIIFPYRSTTKDEIKIKLPEGFTLEEASAPQDLPMGKMADYAVNIYLNKGQRELTYQRTFTLKALTFAPGTYPAIRRAFEAVHQLDGHTLALRQDAAPAAPAPANETPAPEGAGAHSS